MKKNPAESTFLLLINYSFELTEVNINDIVFWWLSLYPSKWVVAAIVEAIYQGRYKVESVNRILNSWHIRGYPVHHFDYDFADVVCKKLTDFGTYRTYKTSKEINKSMHPKENASLEQKSFGRLFAANQENSAHDDTKNWVKPIRKNTPNQEISQHEKLVVRLSI